MGRDFTKEERIELYKKVNDLVASGYGVEESIKKVGIGHSSYYRIRQQLVEQTGKTSTRKPKEHSLSAYRSVETLRKQGMPLEEALKEIGLKRSSYYWVRTNLKDPEQKENQKHKKNRAISQTIEIPEPPQDNTEPPKPKQNKLKVVVLEGDSDDVADTLRGLFS